MRNLILEKSLFGILLVMAGISASAQGVFTPQWVSSQVGLVNSVAYSPNGAQFATGGFGGLQLTTTATGSAIDLPTAASSGVNSVAFSPAGNLLADGGENRAGGVAEIWNATTGKFVSSFNTNSLLISSVAFSPNGSLLVVGGTTAQGTESVLQLWNVSTGKLVSTFKSSATTVFSVAISPDGNALADAGDGEHGGVVEVWNLSTEAKLHTFPTEANSGAYSVAFSADGTTVVDGGQLLRQYKFYGVVELWNVSTGRLTQTLATAANAVYSLAFSPTANKLAVAGSGNSGGVIEEWNLGSGGLVASFPTAATTAVSSVAYSTSGSKLSNAAQSLSGLAAVGMVETWNASTGAPVGTSAPAANNIIDSLAFSADSATVVVGGSGFDAATGENIGILQLQSAQTGKIIQSFSTQANEAAISVAISPDGTKLAVGGYTTNPVLFVNHGIVEIWDIPTGKRLHTLSTASNSIQSVQFSPDGTTLAIGGLSNGLAGELELWNVSTGAIKSSLPTEIHNGISSVAFSSDGKTLAAGGTSREGSGSELTGIVELWNLSVGKRSFFIELPSTNSVNSVAFSPDGSQLAAGGNTYNAGAGSYTSFVEMVSPATGKTLATLPVLTGTTSVNTVRFSADGKTLLAGTDTGIQAFNSTNFGLLQNFSVGGVNAVAVSSGLILYGTPNGAIVAAPLPIF